MSVVHSQARVTMERVRTLTDTTGVTANRDSDWPSTRTVKVGYLSSSIQRMLHRDSFFLFVNSDAQENLSNQTYALGEKLSVSNKTGCRISQNRRKMVRWEWKSMSDIIQGNRLFRCWMMDLTDFKLPLWLELCTCNLWISSSAWKTLMN